MRAAGLQPTISTDVVNSRTIHPDTYPTGNSATGNQIHGEGETLHEVKTFGAPAEGEAEGRFVAESFPKKCARIARGGDAV